jgi:hypothetical protein
MGVSVRQCVSVFFCLLLLKFFVVYVFFRVLSILDSRVCHLLTLTWSFYAFYIIYSFARPRECQNRITNIKQRAEFFSSSLLSRIKLTNTISDLMY